jgi:hypothetical protein
MAGWLKFIYSDAGLALLATVIIGGGLSFYLSKRGAYERGLVDFDAGRSHVDFHEGDGLNHQAFLWLLNRGPRATVIRDVKLVDKDGGPFLSYRSAKGRCKPELPIRLDASDEKVIQLDLAKAEETRLDHFSVELIGDTRPVNWPYRRLVGRASAGAGAAGRLDVAPSARLSGDSTNVRVNDSTTSTDSNVGDVKGPIKPGQ